MIETPRAQIHLAYSSPNFSKLPRPSDHSRSQQTATSDTSAPSSPISSFHGIAGRLQWCAIEHPHMMQTFLDIIDELQEKAGVKANGHEGPTG